MSLLHTLARSKIVWTLAAVAAAVLVVGLWAFQPWRLFTSSTVNEAAPSAEPVSSLTQPAPALAILARGTLISHEHGTTGTVVILQRPNGTRVLRLENLDTSDGPDLHVWLSDAKVAPGRAGWFVFDDGAYLDLGSLKANKGNQNYEIPSGADFSRLRSVSIWCDRFNVSFGAAALS